MLSDKDGTLFVCVHVRRGRPVQCPRTKRARAQPARLFGAASALRAEIGLARRPTDQAGYDTDVVRARDALGEHAFDSAWAEGEAYLYAYGILAPWS